MPFSSAKDAVQRLWRQRWVRRVSYTLVGGAAVVGSATWFFDRPFVYQWLVRQADAALQKETGLSLAVRGVEFHPMLGTLTLRDVAVGGDLLTVARLDLQADPGSLFSRHPHLLALRIDQPHLRLTEANLRRIRLRPRPPRKGPLPQVTLDHLTITGGILEVPESFRGIPAAWVHFEAVGTGGGANRMFLTVTAPKLAVKAPDGLERGRIDLKGEVSEPLVLLHEGYFRLGESQIRIRGRFDPASPQKPERVEARLNGVLGLAQVLRWAGAGRRPALTGDLDFGGMLQGSLAHPRWTLSTDGQDLRPGLAHLAPGNLTLRAEGNSTHLKLDRFRWQSAQGEVEASGTWAKGMPARLRLEGRNLSLDEVGRLLHAPELQGTHASLSGEAVSPDSLQAWGRLDRWSGQFHAAFTQGGAPAGGARLALKGGAASLQNLALQLADLDVQGSADAQLGPRSLRSLQAQGSAQVDAAQVARALSDWKVVAVGLDMSGNTHAQASIRWSRQKGLELDGSAAVDTPRWHGATADHLTAQVAIRGSDLEIHDIDVVKGQGRAGGDLWLTWAPVPRGQKQIDMCFTAFRLPVAEGLRAADVRDADGKELPITGTGSGWVRIHGPYDHLLMAGEAQAEAGQVYGIRIPAASGDFDMDLDTLRLKLDDVRIAERPDLLGDPTGRPEGPLALRGRADIDLTGWTWRVDLAGQVDSKDLGLPGPRIQSQMDARLLGPITAPFGALDLPEGRITLSQGRLFLLGRSVEGLHGEAELTRGHLASLLSAEGRTRPFLTLQARTKGIGLIGNLDLRIDPDTAPTAPLARSLTEDLLQDMQAGLTASGTWTPAHGLQWTGHVDRLEGLFKAFELHQRGPSDLNGTASNAHIDLTLDGGERDSQGPAGSAAAIHLSGALPFSPEAQVSLEANGSADLGHLKAILDRVMEVDEYSLLSGLNVKGESRFDLLFHGTYLDPLLDGTLRLEHGEMHLQKYQGVENLDATFRLKDRTLSIPADQPMTGVLARGQLRASGSLTWRPGGIDKYGFQASLANFQLMDLPEGLDLRGTLQADLQGDENGGLLSGRLRADHLGYQAEINLSDLILQSALGDSGGLTGLDPDDPLDRIRLHLALDLRNPWTFDTNLLKLEGRTEGRFQVLGTLAHPVPSGTVVFTPGGRLTNVFPAGDMVVDHGSLDFKGDTGRIDPLINIQGSVTSIPGYTVNLDIRGTLSNLNIVPTSTPSLRQDEIVAILINPANASSVGTGATTSTQGVLTSGLASASAGLLSTLAFAPFQDQLRRTLGLDRVNVAVRTSSLGTTETDVTLGKSINLFGQRSAFVVSHQKSAELTTTSGQVEWRFGGFILQLGVSQSGQSGLNPSGEIRHTWSPK